MDTRHFCTTYSVYFTECAPNICIHVVYCTKCTHNTTVHSVYCTECTQNTTVHYVYCTEFTHNTSVHSVYCTECTALHAIFLYIHSGQSRIYSTGDNDVGDGYRVDNDLCLKAQTCNYMHSL